MSGPSNATIIPRSASAAISLRIVPDQELSAIKNCVVEYLNSEYKRFGSGNKLKISIDHEAEPWLGDPENDAFRTLESAIMDAWSTSNAAGDKQKVKPLYIREGGSIPTARFLEKEFGAPAAHLPCGQASDHAHLDNERLRLVNLYKVCFSFRLGMRCAFLTEWLGGVSMGHVLIRYRCLEQRYSQACV